MNPETNHCRSVYGITNKGGKGHVVLTSCSCNHSHPQPMFIIFGASYLMFIPGPQLGCWGHVWVLELQPGWWCLGLSMSQRVAVISGVNTLELSPESLEICCKMCMCVYIYKTIPITSMTLNVCNPNLPLNFIVYFTGFLLRSVATSRCSPCR